MPYVVFFGEDVSGGAEKSRVTRGDTQSTRTGIQSSYPTGRQNLLFCEIYNNTSYVILKFAIIYYYYVTYNCKCVSALASVCVPLKVL